MIRFIRSAKIGSKSAMWLTTSSVLHFPAMGRATSCSRVIPFTAWRSAVAPARYWSASSDGVDMAIPVAGFRLETVETELL